MLKRHISRAIRTPRRRLAVLLVTALMALIGTGVTTSTAQAAVCCGGGGGPTVRGKAIEISGLPVYAADNTLVTYISDGSWGTVLCYITGGDGGNGDLYWDYVQWDNGYSGYSADWYVLTGGNINLQVKHC
jgi:hypothetical protein